MDLSLTQVIHSEPEDSDEADTSSQEVQAVLRVFTSELPWKTKTFVLKTGQNVVGRSPDCQIVIDHKVISKEHACIEVNKNYLFLQDLGSTNKTKMGKATLVPRVQYKLEYEEDISLGGLKAQVLKHLESASNENDRGSDTCSESLLTAIEVPQDQQLGDIEGTPGDKGLAAGSTGSQTSTLPCSNSNDGSQTGLPKAQDKPGDDEAVDEAVDQVADDAADEAADDAAVPFTSGLHTARSKPTNGASSIADSEVQSGDDFKLPLMPHIDFTQTESSERADSEQSESGRADREQNVQSSTGCGNKGMGSGTSTKEQEAFARAPTQSNADTGGTVGEADDYNGSHNDSDGRGSAFQKTPREDAAVDEDDDRSDNENDEFRSAPTQGYVQAEVSAEDEEEEEACSDRKDDSFRNAPTQGYTETEVSVEEDDGEACFDRKDDSFRNAPTQGFTETEVSAEEDDERACSDVKDYSFRNAPTQGFTVTEVSSEEDDEGACSNVKDYSFRNAPTQGFTETEGTVVDDDGDGTVEESDVNDKNLDKGNDSFCNAVTQGYTQVESIVDNSFADMPTQLDDEDADHELSDEGHGSPTVETRMQARDSETSRPEASGTTAISTERGDKNEKELSTVVPPQLGTSVCHAFFLSADTEPPDDSVVLCAASQADGDQTDDEEDFCAPTQTDSNSATLRIRPVDTRHSTSVSVNETPPLSPKSAIEETPPSSPSIVPESDPEDGEDSLEDVEDSMVTARRSLTLLETTGESLFQDCDEYGDSEVILSIGKRSNKTSLVGSRTRSGGKLAKDDERASNRKTTQLKVLVEEPDLQNENLGNEPCSKEPRVAKKLEFASSASGASAKLSAVPVPPEEAVMPGDVSRCEPTSEGASFSIPGVAPLLQSPQVPPNEKTEVEESGKATLDPTFTVGDSHMTVGTLSEMTEDCYGGADAVVAEGVLCDAKSDVGNKLGQDHRSTELLNHSKQFECRSGVDEEKAQMSDVEEVVDEVSNDGGAHTGQLSEKADVSVSVHTEGAVEDAEPEPQLNMSPLEATEDVSKLGRGEQTEVAPLPFSFNLPTTPDRMHNIGNEVAGEVSKATKKSSSKRKVPLNSTETTKDVVPPPTRSRRSNAGKRMKAFLSIEKRTEASGNFREDLVSQESPNKQATSTTKEQSFVEPGASKQRKRGRKSGAKEQTEEDVELREPSLSPQPKEKSQVKSSVAAVADDGGAVGPVVVADKSYLSFSRGVWDSQCRSTPYVVGTLDTCLSEPFATFSQLMAGAGDDCRTAAEQDEADATDATEPKKSLQQESEAVQMGEAVAKSDSNQELRTRRSSRKVSEASSSRVATDPDRSKKSLNPPVNEVTNAKGGRSKRGAAKHDTDSEEPKDLVVVTLASKNVDGAPDSDETQDLDALVPAAPTRPKPGARHDTPLVKTRLAKVPVRKAKFERLEGAEDSDDEFQGNSQAMKESATKQIAASSRPSRRPSKTATSGRVQDARPSARASKALSAKQRTQARKPILLDALVSESDVSDAGSVNLQQEASGAVGGKKEFSQQPRSKRAATVAAIANEERESQSSHTLQEVPRGKRGKNMAVPEISDVVMIEAESATEELKEQGGVVRGKDRLAASSRTRGSQSSGSPRGKRRAPRVSDAPVLESEVTDADTEEHNEASTIYHDNKKSRSLQSKGAPTLAEEAAQSGTEDSQSSQSNRGKRKTRKGISGCPVLESDATGAGSEEPEEAATSDADESRRGASQLKGAKGAAPRITRGTPSSQRYREKGRTKKEVPAPLVSDSVLDSSTEEFEDASSVEKNKTNCRSLRSKGMASQASQSELQGTPSPRASRGKPKAEKDAPHFGATEEPRKKPAATRRGKKSVEEPSCSSTATTASKDRGGVDPKVVLEQVEEIPSSRLSPRSKATTKERAVPAKGCRTGKATEATSKKKTRESQDMEEEPAELPKPTLKRGQRKATSRNLEEKPPLDQVGEKETVKVEEVALPPKRQRGRPPKKAAVKVEVASQEANTSRGRKREGLPQDPAPSPRKKGRGEKGAAATAAEALSPKMEVGASQASKARRSSNLKPRVMFTGLADTAGEEIVKNLGGLVAASPSMCTHLVTDKFRRTVKTLSCVAKGIPILSMAWLNSCRASGSFVDHAPFLLKDKAAEKSMVFNLEATLKRASEGGIFHGWSLHVTPGVLPQPQDMKEIVTCAGGKYLAKMPTRYADKTVIVSCAEDRQMLAQARKSGIPLVLAEFVLSGLLQYKLDLKKHTLV